VLLDADGRILLVRRGREPGRGRWSVPGGRVEAGEPEGAAAVREAAEETGLAVEVVRPLGTVTRDAPGGGTYVITDYLARCVAGPTEPVAADDADETRWVTREQMRSLELVDGLQAALADWGVLPD
jgi:8-oxo-dGTP diphosphatase